jgi:hypothetical protein
MRWYKIIARIVPILPIVNFAFAIPIAVQETRQVGRDVVPDVAITMSAKRGQDEQMEKLWDTYFERLPEKPESSSASHPPSGPAQPDDQVMAKLWDKYFEKSSGKPESSSAAHPSLDPAQSESGHALLPSPASSTTPDHGSVDPPQMDKSEIQQVSTVPESGSGPSVASGSGPSTLVSPPERPESKSFLGKVVSKLKFWRRISGPGSVRDAVNAAQRELQGLVDTGAYVSSTSPESQTF